MRRAHLCSRADRGSARGHSTCVTSKTQGVNVASGCFHLPSKPQVPPSECRALPEGPALRGGPGGQLLCRRLPGRLGSLAWPQPRFSRKNTPSTPAISLGRCCHLVTSQGRARAPASARLATRSQWSEWSLPSPGTSGSLVCVVPRSVGKGLTPQACPGAGRRVRACGGYPAWPAHCGSSLSPHLQCLLLPPSAIPLPAPLASRSGSR